ncbi:hypothetical protein GGQ92_002678 [Gracilibacillus halotolerans]|uniref:Beta-N-acetylhexosaminidase n=1 Tax=Gracilibacillus halotolerans TaxID=74386 RepID=A0A841RMZ2_9BACI|nr:hypothetical protein [Gracilibacillus halotolerans]
MEIALKGDYERYVPGLKELKKEINFHLSDGGIPLVIEMNNNEETVIRYENGQGLISCSDNEYNFYRAFSLFIENMKRNETFFLRESAQFRTVGPMFDLSRNTVMNIEAFKGMLRKLSLMGFNSAMLYMEDTYEIADEPYFGYMRGRYSEEELRQLDDYAAELSIELIPSIQTLAHLEEFLKWEAVANLKDTRGILLVGEESTYEFTKRMIEAATKPFRTNRIHIGMDEAEELGRGIYLNKFGHKDRLELMVSHLKRILAIVNEKGLEPMMWSDMFLKLASDSGIDQYDMDIQISDDLKNLVPKNVDLVFWDYYHTDVQDYKSLIKKHKEISGTPVFAGGIWVWNTFGVNYTLSLKASEAALLACKEEGVRDVFVTMWGDDGFESNYFAAMLGLQYYAEHQYSKTVDEEKWHERLKFCTGLDAETYMYFDQLDNIPGVEEGSSDQTNPSKFLLWQDVLLGLFDKHIEGLEVGAHYEQLSQKIASSRDASRELDFILDVPEKLAAVLAKKAQVGIRLKTAYDGNDKEELREIATTELPKIMRRVEALKQAHKVQWLTLNKPFGWEVLDIRYGGLISRLATAIERLTDYVDGNLDKIEELEQERLPYNSNLDKTSGLGWSSYYYRIATPNVFFHVLPIY